MSCNDNDTHADSLQNCCATDWHKPGYGEFPGHNSFLLLGSDSELETNVQPSLMSRAINHKEPPRLSCTFKNYQSVGGYFMSDPKGFARNMDSL